jgi:hypothetical protein
VHCGPQVRPHFGAAAKRRLPCGKRPVQASRSAQDLAHNPHQPTTRANGRDHDRAIRRQTPGRPANAAAAPGQTAIARALAGAVAEAVGCVQARDRQGDHTGRHHHGGAPRPDRLVRGAGQAESYRRHADGAEQHLPHFLDDQADRLGRHHDAAICSSTTPSRNTFRNFPTRRSASRTTASSTWYHQYAR